MQKYNRKKRNNNLLLLRNHATPKLLFPIALRRYNNKMFAGARDGLEVGGGITYTRSDPTDYETYSYARPVE